MWSLHLGATMPHASNPKTFEELVGKQPKVDVLLARVCEVTGWNYLKTRYHYFDKRSKALSLSYLRDVRLKSQKVHCTLSNIKHAGVQHGNHSESD